MNVQQIWNFTHIASQLKTVFSEVANQQHDHITDIELLNHFKSDGNREWLGILLERYSLLLFGVCMKYLKSEEEAKDAVQQVFLKAISELEKYPVQYPKSWLYKVACNLCLMKIRDRKTLVSLEDTSIEAPESDMLNEKRIQEHNLVLLEQSLSELSEEQQSCVTLFYLNKKSYHNISRITGYSLAQVKSHIQNGKRNLRLLINKKRSGHE